VATRPRTRPGLPLRSSASAPTRWRPLTDGRLVILTLTVGPGAVLLVEGVHDPLFEHQELVLV
jgi:hypothetical protein